MQGGFTNVYAQRIFCGWDFGITNCEAAELRKQTLYNELRELLDEEIIAEKSGAKTWMQRLVLMSCRVGVTVLVCSLLIGSGVLVWFLLDKQYLLVNVSCNLNDALMSESKMIFLNSGPPHTRRSPACIHDDVSCCYWSDVVPAHDFLTPLCH